MVEFLDLAPQINNHSTTPVALRLSTRRTAPPFASLEGGELNVFIKFVTIDGVAGGFATERTLVAALEENEVNCKKIFISCSIEYIDWWTTTRVRGELTKTFVIPKGIKI